MEKIKYKKTMTKPELLAIAEENGLDVNEEMTAAAIIAAIDAYNAQTADDTAPKPADESEETPDTYVYVGPSLPRGRLKENTLFRGTLSDVRKYLADAIERYPQISKLIVPTGRLAEYSVKVKTKGNIAHQYYRDIASAIAGNREV